MNENDLSIPEEFRPAWEALDDAAPEPLSGEAVRRIGEAVQVAVEARAQDDGGLEAGGGDARGAQGRWTGAAAPTRWRFVASIALAMSVGAAGGYGISVLEPGDDPASAVIPGAETYLLLVRETPGTQRALQERGVETVVEEYASWARDLASRGRLVAAEKLSDGVAWVGTDAAEAPSSISGFFLIRAGSEGEALRIARESPHAELGGVLEVRRVESGSPEG